MAPSARTSSSSRTKPFTRRIRRKSKTPRTQFKKKQNHHPPQIKNQEISKIKDIPEDSPSSSSSSEVSTDEPSSSTSCCSTPKGQKFRIPEISTCPPAPKKKKPRSLLSNNCSLRRPPISFFAPPDLELFFFLALPDNISV